MEEKKTTKMLMWTEQPGTEAGSPHQRISFKKKDKEYKNKKYIYIKFYRYVFLASHTDNNNLLLKQMSFTLNKREGLRKNFV